MRERLKALMMLIKPMKTKLMPQERARLPTDVPLPPLRL